MGPPREKRRKTSDIERAPRVALFFKWIKQHLRVKTFFGMSENAVKTQMWIAIGVYALVAIVKRLRLLPRSIQYPIPGNNPKQRTATVTTAPAPSGA